MSQLIEKIAPNQARLFSNLLSQSAGDDLDFILNEIEYQQAELFRFFDGSMMVTRIEAKEMVVVCFEGSELKAKVTFIVNLAKSTGLNSIRFHTKRPALQRLIQQHAEFLEVERVYRLGI